VTQINANNINNINNMGLKQPLFKAGELQQPYAPAVQIPNIYYTPDDKYEQKSFKEAVKDADIMGLVYQWLEHPLLMIGTCAGLAYGVDKFSKACGGSYETSLVGKAANLGDKIQNSKFVQSKGFQGVLNGGKNVSDGVKHFFRNSDVLKSIFTTPSKPQCSMVLDEMLSQEQRVAREFLEIADGLKLTGEEAGGSFFGLGGGGGAHVRLKDLGLTSEERTYVKGFADEADAVNRVLLKRLGRSEADISTIVSKGDDAVKEELLKELGFTKDELTELRKGITSDSAETVKQSISKIKEAANKGKNKIWIGKGEYCFGKYSPVKRVIGCDEVFNRLHSINGGAKTATGRAMSRFLQNLHRGFTFGGGKLGVLAFVSPMLVETMMDVKNADKDQKVGTAAHGLVEAVSWVFTFPLALKIMHSLTGAQYAGMSKEKIEEVRKIKKEFNNTVFDNHSQYKDALKIQKAKVAELEHVEGQNLLTKMCRKLGKFITIDLERFKSYRNGGFVENTLRKTGGFFKNIAGVPMRLVIWGCLSMIVLGGALTKGTKAIFGNYYDRMKEEEHTEQKKQQKKFTKSDLQQRLYDAQLAKLSQQEDLQSQRISYDNELRLKDVNVNDANQKVPNSQNIQENQNVTIEKPLTNKNASKSDNVDNVETPRAIMEPSIDMSQPQKSPVEAPKRVDLRQDTLKQNKVDDYTYVPNSEVGKEVLQSNKVSKQDNYTYIPSQDSGVKNVDEQSTTNKYIPSQRAAKIDKTYDNSGLEAALRRADKAEQQAIQILSGNYPA
jgi:hypothetical protein